VFEEYKPYLEADAFHYRACVSLL